MFNLDQELKKRREAASEKGVIERKENVCKSKEIPEWMHDVQGKLIYGEEIDIRGITASYLGRVIPEKYATKYDKRLDLSKCYFEQSLSITNITFEEVVDLSGVSCERPVEFTDCVFKKDVILKDARVDHQVSFSGCSFERELDCTECVIGVVGEGEYKPFPGLHINDCNFFNLSLNNMKARRVIIRGCNITVDISGKDMVLEELRVEGVTSPSLCIEHSTIKDLTTNELKTDQIYMEGCVIEEWSIRDPEIQRLNTMAYEVVKKLLKLCIEVNEQSYTLPHLSPTEGMINSHKDLVCTDEATRILITGWASGCLMSSKEFEEQCFEHMEDRVIEAPSAKIVFGVVDLKHAGHKREAYRVKLSELLFVDEFRADFWAIKGDVEFKNCHFLSGLTMRGGVIQGNLVFVGDKEKMFFSQLLTKLTETRGMVISSCNIGGNCDLTQVELERPKKRRDDDHCALDAQNCIVGGALKLSPDEGKSEGHSEESNKTFKHIHGDVDLSGASIGVLILSGSSFSDKEKNDKPLLLFQKVENRHCWGMAILIILGMVGLGWGLYRASGNILPTEGKSVEWVLNAGWVLILFPIILLSLRAFWDLYSVYTSKVQVDVDRGGKLYRQYQRVFALKDLFQVLSFNWFFKPQDSSNSGHSDDGNKGPVNITFERTEVDKLLVMKPLPTIMSINHLNVRQYDLDGVMGYLEFLDHAEEFARSNYLSMELNLRNEGKNEEADKLHREMRRHEQWREHRVLTTAFHLLHSIVGYGTQYWKLTFVMGIWFAYTVILFNVDGLSPGIEMKVAVETQDRINKIAEILEVVSSGPKKIDGQHVIKKVNATNQSKLENRSERERRDVYQDKENLPIAIPIIVALRYHIPVITFDAYREIEPMKDELTNYAAVVQAIHWILWPLLLASLVPKLIPNREQISAAIRRR